MKFVLNGVEHELTPEQVQDRLSDVLPARVRHHGVRIDRRVFPVKQAFEVVTGSARSDFTTQLARQQFAALGFELVGAADDNGQEPDSEHPEALPTAEWRPKEAAISRGTTTGRSTAAVPARTPAGEEWHTKALTRAALVAHLVDGGWRIVSTANPLTREHEIDVVAERDEETLAFAVEGYPSENRSRSTRSGDRQPTQPLVRAAHWYAEAVLAAMRARSRRPQARSIIALPDFPAYRDLHAETADSLTLIGIELWWVTQDGVTHP